MSKTIEKPATEAVASTALFCFETEAHGVKSYVWSQTRGKAAAATIRSANDAGYKTRMPDVRCRRRKELDDFDLLDRRLQPNRPYCPDFIQQNAGRQLSEAEEGATNYEEV